MREKRIYGTDRDVFVSFCRFLTRVVIAAAASDRKGYIGSIDRESEIKREKNLYSFACALDTRFSPSIHFFEHNTDS